MTKRKQWRDLSFSEKYAEMEKTEEGRKILEEGYLQSEENERMDIEEGKYSHGFIDHLEVEEDLIGYDYNTDDGESDNYDENEIMNIIEDRLEINIHLLSKETSFHDINFLALFNLPVTNLNSLSQ